MNDRETTAITIDEIVDAVKQYQPNANTDLVRKAYDLAHALALKRGSRLKLQLDEEGSIEIPDEQIENVKTVGDIVHYIEDNT